MKKKVLCLVMAMVLVAGSGFSVKAEDYQGKDNWVAEFNGKEITSNFSSDDLTDEAKNIQPGDSITLKVKIKNSDSAKTDWYMTNQAIQSLEDAKESASGGAYEYRLAYTGANGEETELYNSETVGGENAAKGEGLHQATNSLTDYFYLDRLEDGDEGVVTLQVRVNGETMGNGYQQTLAKLQQTFAVEKVTETTVINKPGENKLIKNVVKTGDTAKTLLFCGLALASGIILLIFGLMTLKRRKNDEREA